MKINLNEVEIEDLNGEVYKVDDLPKQIGNVIFKNAESIEISDYSRKLHAGEDADVNEAQLAEIAEIVSLHVYYKPFVHNAIIGYFNQKLTELKNVKPKKNEN